MRAPSFPTSGMFLFVVAVCLCMSPAFVSQPKFSLDNDSSMFVSCPQLFIYEVGFCKAKLKLTAFVDMEDFRDSLF